MLSRYVTVEARSLLGAKTEHTMTCVVLAKSLTPQAPLGFADTRRFSINTCSIEGRGVLAMVRASEFADLWLMFGRIRKIQDVLLNYIK